MSRARRAAVFGAATLALLTATGSAVAGTWQPGAATNASARWTLTTSIGGSETLTSAPVPGAGPVLHIDRRALIAFTVGKATTVQPCQISLPAGAGRYVAYFFFGTNQGWAALTDPGSRTHWPTVLPFGPDIGTATFYPHRRYVVAIATDESASVRLPFAVRVLSIHHTSFPVNVVIHQIRLPVAPMAATAASTSTGSPRDRAFNAAAITLDWNDDPSPLDVHSGNACLSQRPTPDCSDSTSNSGYLAETRESGQSGGAAQVTFGHGWAHPVSATYIDGEAVTVPTPFDSATLYGFGMNPNQ